MGDLSIRMPSNAEFLSQFNRVIDSCRNILRLDGITGMDSMKHLTLYILARALTVEECRRLDISEAFSWDKFMNLLTLDKKQDAYNLLFCSNGADQDLISNLDRLFETRNFNFKLKNIEYHASLLKEINKIDFKNLEGQVDILGTVYENHLGSGSNKSAMRDLGQFFTDRKVCNYMVDLCQPKILEKGRAESVLDPTMGTGGFLTSYVKYLNSNNMKVDWSKMQMDVAGYDIDEFVMAVGRINMYLSTGVIFDRIKHRDSLHKDVGEPGQRLKFKIILANEPFGVKGLIYKDCCQRVKDLGINGTKSEPLFLNLMMAALDEGGRCAVVVPDGVLVNNSNQHNGTRKYLLDHFELKRVIKMKGQFFSNTGIQPSILFFENTGNPTSVVEFWEVEQDSKGVIIEKMVLSVAREKFDDACSLDMRRYQEVAAVVNPAGFKMVKLGDVCELLSGKGNNYKQDGDTYPYYDSNGVTGTRKDFCFEGDHIITARKMSIGAVHYATGKFWSSDNTINICVKDTSILLSRFCYYWLHVNNQVLKELSSGIKPGIRKSDVAEIKMPLPPLPIQQEIVTALDHIHNNAATAKAAAASVKSQMAAVVRSVGARGFERKKLGDVCLFVNGYAFKSDEFIETGVPVVKIKNIKNNLINLDNADHCLENNKLSSFIVKENDMVISLTGELSGDVGINRSGKEGYLNQRTARIDITSQEVNNKYMYYYMVYSDFVQNVRELSTGSAQPNVSTKKIEELNFPLPPLPIQHEVLAILNEMEAELATLEQMAAKAEQRAKFILDGYLNPAPTPVIDTAVAESDEVPQNEIVENVVGAPKPAKRILKLKKTPATT